MLMECYLQLNACLPNNRLLCIVLKIFFLSITYSSPLDICDVRLESYFSPHSFIKTTDNLLFSNSKHIKTPSRFGQVHPQSLESCLHFKDIYVCHKFTHTLDDASRVLLSSRTHQGAHYGLQSLKLVK